MNGPPVPSIWSKSKPAPTAFAWSWRVRLGKKTWRSISKNSPVGCWPGLPGRVGCRGCQRIKKNFGKERCWGFMQRPAWTWCEEQIEACLGTPCPAYDVGAEDMIVWPGPDDDTEVVYNLREEPLLHPRRREGRLADNMPVLAADKVVFRNNPITWKDWVAAWSRDS